MRYVYIDRTDYNENYALHVEGAQVVNAGTTVYALPRSQMGEKFEKYQTRYGLKFIFQGEEPQADFYAVPQLDIFAADGAGGYMGTLGSRSDFGTCAPICYVDADRICWYAAKTGPEFLANMDRWRERLTPCPDLRLYSSKDEAARELEFLDPPQP